MNIDMLSDYTGVDVADTFRQIAEAGQDIVDAQTGELIIVRHREVRALLPAAGLTTKRPQRDLLALDSLPPAAREIQLAMKAHYARWPLFSDGDYHRRLRRYLTRSMTDIVEVVAGNAADHLREAQRQTAGSSFSWLERVAEPIAASLVGTILDVHADEAAVLIDRATVIVRELAWPILDDARAADAVTAQRDLASWLERALPSAQGSTRYLRALRAIADDPALGFESASATLAQTITGAYDPLVSVLGTLALTVGPRELAALAPETIAEEVLRLATPFRFARRFTTEPARLAGHEVPAETRIFLGLAAANLDPRAFPDPTSLAARQSPHVAFGLGRHYCLGADAVRSCLVGVVGALVEARAAFTAHHVAYAPELSILRFTAMDGSWRAY
ncbi:cytochrome P450 [Phytohabitans houttuyneae]|uniref:cytochrome P450 n=1 Tax=Phytohabitans houttuyneae TaxID=1076126 RepID=UPI0015663005|nr:cytochrome P450 [Phytohabitans houttuyneae]